MKKVAFTICAKNYIGLALLLESSLRSKNDEVDFFIFVADEFDIQNENEYLAENIIESKKALDLSPELWNELSFKYDLTEFCTCIKPSCFKYIFKKFNPDYAIYFDPDILVFDSLDYIFNCLHDKSLVITPHITSMEDSYTGNLNEQNLLYSGMFNLGFIALRNDEISIKMLNWWEIRLKDRCFRSMTENLFTDQKWIDFLPSFFPSQLLISFHLGLNIAPWNYHEREIVFKDNSFFVRSRNHSENSILFPLIFAHFSGFNYIELMKDDILHGNMNNLLLQPDLESIFRFYSDQLKVSSFLKFYNLTYSYNYFSDGTYISLIYRKLYRRLLNDGKIQADPFNSRGHLYLSLKRNGLLKHSLSVLDKSTIQTVQNVNKKLLVMNKLFYILFKIVGVQRFFMLTKLLRLYSKPENHIYLIDKSYMENFTPMH